MTAVETDAHAHTLVRVPALGRELTLYLQRRRRRGAGGVEHAEHFVTACIDLAAACSCDRTPLQVPRPLEHRGVGVSEPGGETARVLDVGEEEGERHRSRVPRTPTFCTGSSACTSVPQPGALSTRSLPSSVSTRSRRPNRPEPSGSAPPAPSSSISINARPLTRCARTRAEPAPECLTTLASASAAT